MSAANRLLYPFRRLIPDQGTVSVRERLRAAVGAMLGLLITGFVSRAALDATGDLPLLIAPMGASAVLLFAVPSSPLAQPWSILGGNTVAALIGVTCGRYLADPVTAAAVACAAAIGVMLILRCLHPPSGAVALTAVLGGPAIHAAGYTFAIWPVGLNSLLLFGTALLFNNATGRRYPHLARPPGLGDDARSPAVTEQDVAAVLRRHDEIVDVDRGDLLELVHEAEDEARGGRLANMTCGSLMTTAGTTLKPETGMEAALGCLAGSARHAVFVTDDDGRLVGSVSHDMVLRPLRPSRIGRAAARMFQRSIRFDLEPQRVADIMQPIAVSVRPEETVEQLATLMIDRELAMVPVTTRSGTLAGIVEMAAVLALLHPPREPASSAP